MGSVWSMSQQDGEHRQDVCTLAAEARVSVLGSPVKNSLGFRMSTCLQKTSKQQHPNNNSNNNSNKQQNSHNYLKKKLHKSKESNTISPDGPVASTVSNQELILIFRISSFPV